MADDDVKQQLEKMRTEFTGCRLTSTEDLTRLRADVDLMMSRVVRLENAVYGTDGAGGLMGMVTSVSSGMERLSKSLERALDILIPPDGKKGLLTRLEDVEGFLNETKDFKKWFYRMLIASVVTAVIGIAVAIFK